MPRQPASGAAGPPRAAGPVVGFDLDMTLLDPRRGVVATYAALAAETGVTIDGEAAAARLGPPLEEEIARWFPPERVAETAASYRELYAVHALPVSLPMPGAADAVAQVRRHGGQVVVVTAKSEPLARASLTHIGIEVDAVEGWRFAETKAEAMIEHDVTIYAGDHVGDIVGAHAAGALAVAVATGPCSADELAAAGADVVLPDLAAFGGWLSSHLLPGRLDDLAARLAGLGSVLVAFSGGADSAFLLTAAVRTLGADRVVAATASSASLPAAELAAATDFAARLGVRHLTPATNEMGREGYRANGPDRCYFCKAELTETLRPLADSLGLVHVVTGTNADDAVAGFRPGIRAAAQRGARTPLLDAGLTKAQVREASRRWGLSTWDKPAAACLASRIAYGIEVSPARLARVERAEAGLRVALAAAGLAVRNLRVRDLDGLAMVEVDADQVAALAARPDLLAALEGFDRVEVDPRGFRSGSMNELLPAVARASGEGGAGR
ncbi:MULTISPECIES: ATP-dependent sacrificial sulfur transferase LarE [Protofrankia]|uniref:ATP-dependent sacrificial sulfur transferase LarE n=1 Tax=Protofrankia TaxID=2994361 RepID=UPI003219FC2B